MRRMISSNKIKVLDNLAVNADSTIIEVDGNVAFETIEQVGYLVDTEPKYEVIKTYDGSLGNQNRIQLNGVTSIENQSGVAPEGFPVYPLEGQVISTSNFGQMIAKVNGVRYYCKVGTIFKGNITKGEDYSTLLMKEYPQGKEFKPFFTEEQYQALLALITNK